MGWCLSSRKKAQIERQPFTNPMPGEQEEDAIKLVDHYNPIRDQLEKDLEEQVQDQSNLLSKTLSGLDLKPIHFLSCCEVTVTICGQKVNWRKIGKINLGRIDEI